MKPLEYIYYRSYSLIRKYNADSITKVSVTATAIAVLVVLLVLLTLYMALSNKGIIHDKGITILILGIIIPLSIFPLDKYFESKHQTFEYRWKQQSKILKTFWGYFIAFLVVALFACFCYLADINHDLDNK